MRGRETEHGIQKAILELLAAHRVFAFRLNTATVQAHYDANGKDRFFTAHSLGPGAADILALVELAGKVHIPVWIEVKGPKGKQSPQQESFQAHVQSYGHRYILAHSVQDVLEGLNL